MKKIYVIAEAGVNHNGNLDLALRLVNAAHQAGADAVKFQTFKAERLVGKGAEKAEYQKRTTEASEGQLEMIRRLELNRAAHLELLTRCSALGIDFLSSAFDLDSIEFLRELGIPLWKIPSGEITNLPYLRRLGYFGSRILLSTGMATLGEVEEALMVLEASGTARSMVTILHCTTEYPAPFDEVNLRAMVTMGKTFGTEFGYSDHTEGIAIPIAAAALGAAVIEKHFTLDRTMEGPDHKASLEPEELAAMIRGIRQVEVSLGDGLKRPTATELINRPIVRKSLVAIRPIKRGEIFSAENLGTKRPGTGLSPMEWDKVMGRIAFRDFEEDETIEL